MPQLRRPIRVFRLSSSKLSQLCTEERSPAVAGLIQIDGEIAAEAALGVRALERPGAVAVDDRWHIGSDQEEGVCLDDDRAHIWSKA